MRFQAPRPDRDRDAPLRVAIVAPSMRILGGQAVQAGRLLRAWAHDADVSAWLVPINPLPPRWLRWALHVKFLRTMVTQLAYWPLLLRELRRADIVHVFSASYFSFLLAPLPAVLVAKLLGRPVVLNYRSGEAPDHLRRSAVARVTLRRVDRNVVPSGFLHDVFASFGVRSEVVPNIVDVERYRFRLRDPLAPRLVSTRNFEGLYNVACTLRAFRLVQDEYPDASLTLVGAGSLEASLREMATALSLRNVSFAGRVPPEGIWRFYADADIYMQTPDIDNMPSSLLEAFSSGTPAVSTDAGGVPAILTGEVDGLLAPVGDHVAVAAQILRLLREPGLAARLATAARARCDQYTWPRVRSQWLTVYRDLMVPAVKKATVSDLTPPGVKKATVRDLTPRRRLAKLRAADSREIRTRVAMLVRRGVRRLTTAAATNKWRRGELASKLVPGDASLQPAVNRLAAGDWMGAHRELMRHFQSRVPRFVLDPAARRPIVSAVTSRFPSACEDAERRADLILAGRHDLLGYRNLQFQPGETASPDAAAVNIDWKLDPVHQRRAPDAWWSDVRYLYSANGDHKIIWELNRHQHWLTLGRAYWLLGREQYRSRFVAELESWLAQNRPLAGVNWASMLELALRGLSWIWALHFFIDDPYDLARPEQDVPWLVDLLVGLDRQMRHVEENLSHYFSPNTHLTGEALGLYVAGRVLPELRASARWEGVGRQVLIEQAATQIAPDGGHLERSTHYHRYTLDFYLFALAIARRTGDTAAQAAFEPIVARLAHFAWAMADANGCLPRIGDDDAGVLLKLGSEPPEDVRPSLSVAASLLPGRVPLEELTEESVWIAGGSASSPAGSAEWDRSTAFPATGYYISRSRSGDHLVFDAGPHGFLNGGHAHADALALTLSLRWHPFLIDTGTGTYTMNASLRDRFRSTALHNTLLLDGLPQSRPDGPFHWDSVANGRAVRWASNARFDFAEGTHDGYSPLAHRRAVFSGGGDLWLVADHVLGGGPHTAALHWHLDPDWDVRIDTTAIEANHADGLRAVIASTAKRLDVFRGDSETGLGWCSPAYGRIVACPTVRFSRSGETPFSIATLILPAHDACNVAIETVPVTGGTPGAYAFAIRAARPDAVELALFVVPPDDVRHANVSPARFTGGTWQFGGFETDARFAHVRLGPTGVVQCVSLVDGSLVRRVADDAFRLQLEQPARDVSVTVDPGGLVEIFSSAPLPSLGLDAPAAVINRVRLNDAPVSFRRHDAALVVPAGQAGTAASRPIETPVEAR